MILSNQSIPSQQQSASGQIPIISYKSTTEERKHEIRSALTSVGFFYLVDHPLVSDMRKAFEYSKKFFDLPFEVKNQFHTLKGGSGYISKSSERLNGTDIDLKEAYNVRLQNSPNDQGEEVNYFPDETQFLNLEGFEKFSKDLFNALHDLLCEILDDLQSSLTIQNKTRGSTEPLENNYFSSTHSDKEHSLRYLHYPKIDKNNLSSSASDRNGAGLHCDYGSITLLFQDDVGGLQVLNRVTNEMMNAPYVPDSMIVNCGDLMQEWTSGEYKSVPHQVVLTNYDRDRYSIAYFGQPNKDCYISSIDMTAYDYLMKKFEKSYTIKQQSKTTTTTP
ncbi:hypothetical protein C9374_012685 [Naegleria lovaniensis]|uniref:Fe2OG dioxygenase domain-containing protein n=1 Tax=Naegleria lovaniensis TaxID=51637 RepID=A0AA88GWR1_NAELO|nr:uncharacterized protein C9374_012685 [Naegleria lovaniensis]KAG2392433.1 hypothetical protein C9374_012685 [Naegleria lovaniensis]